MFLENIRLAFHSLTANKMRTFLTMLGIMIGVGAVVAIETLGAGQTKQMEQQYAAGGVNNIQLYEWQDSYDDSTPSYSFTIPMIQKMADKYGDQIEAIDFDLYGNSYKAVTSPDKADSEYANVTMEGVNNGHFVVQNVTLKTGKYFSTSALDNGDNSCIVSTQLVDNLFGGNYDGAVGKDIQLLSTDADDDSTMTYTIVGVYTFTIDASYLRQMSAKDIKDINTPIFVPYLNCKPLLQASVQESLQDDSYDPTTINYLTLQAVDGTDIASFTTELQNFMQSQFSSDTGVTVQAYSNKEMIDEAKKYMKQQTTTISLIAAIALLVGGIGVMNIMTVTITERTREIGTRKAMGAKRSAIRQQFIIEAMVMCFIGGAIGIAGGLVGGIIGCKVMKYSVAIPFGAIAAALGISLAIGIFFGYYPANKAAKMDPIEALRYE